MDELQKIKTSHPNIYNIWSNFINIKFTNYLQSLIELNTMIDNIKEYNLPDLNTEQICFFINLSKAANDINTTSN